MMVRATATWRLDASTFFSSVPDFIPRRFWRFHFMKNLVIGITLATLAAPAFAQNPPALKDSKDKVSYSIGLDIGTTFKKQKMEISSDALVAGLKDGMSGTKPL
jgi:FKBP-type peptidyl-prolyl cis-trans isomerases 1